MCRIEVDRDLLDRFRSSLIARFPGAAFDVRLSVIKYLYSKQEDTAYGVSIGVGKPLPSVVKALKVLCELGYVVGEERESHRRRKKVTIYRLSDRGRMLAFVLLAPDVEIPPISTSFKVVEELINEWSRDEKLKSLLAIAMLSLLNPSRPDVGFVYAALFGLDELAYMIIDEIAGEVRGIAKEKLLSYFSLLPHPDQTLHRLLKNNISRLLKCPETRDTLVKTAKMWIDFYQELSINTLLFLTVLKTYLESGDIKIEEVVKDLQNRLKQDFPYLNL